MKKINLILFILFFGCFFNSLFAIDVSLDSLISDIKSALNNEFNIEQSGSGNVDMLKYSAAVFRNNKSLSSSEEYCYRSKKFGYAAGAGKYYRRIGFGIYNFKDSNDLKKIMFSFLEGHEVNPQKFYKEGKQPALSPPFLILIKDNILLFFYAKCEDIPKKKDWDKFTEPFILMAGNRLTHTEVMRCYCGGPVYIIR
ncbi:MAG: hypothetical protein EPN82_15145 [Bacteroidetes bacterium]|nr:MAG: hypothetical protein EPN82_15145 [Bacteroidota bacterium]